MTHLTERQRQCIEGFIARKTAKEIGRDLGITHHAVEQHLKNARRKLGATDTRDAARRYAEASGATVGPYYAPAELLDEPFEGQQRHQPEQASFLLRDVATEAPKLVQTLTIRQTLIAIVLSGLGMALLMALIVSIANGAAQLAS